MHHEKLKTLNDLREMIMQIDMQPNRKRDMASAITRLCEMLQRSPKTLDLDPSKLRILIKTIRPVMHGISPKTLSNIRALVGAALVIAGELEPVARGVAKRDVAWRGLVQAIATDHELVSGLAAFMNWCASNGSNPEDVCDSTLREFLDWLETRTLHPNPRELTRRVPILWTRARESVTGWPTTNLTRLSFKAPSQRWPWDQLSTEFRQGVEAYIAKRQKPDLFDESDRAPRRPLSSKTLHLHRQQLHTAASVLIRSKAISAKDITLEFLVRPEPFKAVLRGLLDQVAKRLAASRHNPSDVRDIGNTPPVNAFAISTAQTLIQVARYHAKVSDEELNALRRWASKLTPVPLDLTEKNKRLLRQLEVPETQARLLFLPERLQAAVAVDLKRGRLRSVDAQIALAIDLQIALPMRPQNLSALDWRRHFTDLGGSAGLRIHIPAAETKGKKRDIAAEIPPEVAARLNWYRHHILPRLDADENGPLFVTLGGHQKDQKTLAVQMIKVIERDVGVHMTPHQFRHFAAVLYLEKNPNDFETVRCLLGHAFAKTTRIYAGSSTARAGRAYGDFLYERKDELRPPNLGTRRRSSFHSANPGG